MMKTRSKKELLKMLIKYIKDNGLDTGICLVISKMYNCGLIEHSEAYELQLYIYENKEKKFVGKIYWWEPGKVQPRLDFLNKLLNK